MCLLFIPFFFWWRGRAASRFFPCTFCIFFFGEATLVEFCVCEWVVGLTGCDCMGVGWYFFLRGCCWGHDFFGNGDSAFFWFLFFLLPWCGWCVWEKIGGNSSGECKFGLNFNFGGFNLSFVLGWVIALCSSVNKYAKTHLFSLKIRYI